LHIRRKLSWQNEEKKLRRRLIADVRLTRATRLTKLDAVVSLENLISIKLIRENLISVKLTKEKLAARAGASLLV
jgi:hypothetical protein